MRGHALCWHNQTPDWIFKDENGNPVKRDKIYSLLKQLINAVKIGSKIDVTVNGGKY